MSVLAELIPLSVDDTAPTESFLRRHLTDSMFLLTNMTPQGIPMRCWLARSEGRVDGVVALVENGIVLPQWPGGDWLRLGPLLAGSEVSGLLGPTSQVRALATALGLDQAARRHDADEPGFRMDLSWLRIPDGPGTLIPLTETHELLARDWRAAYDREVLHTPHGEARARARRDVRRWIANGSHRLLMAGETPLALTGFNASLPDVVQVGGVYVPPALRERGHARRAVALHLAEARAAGVSGAVLFAVSEAAARAYLSIGFQPDGGLTMILFERAQRIVPCR